MDVCTSSSAFFDSNGVVHHPFFFFFFFSIRSIRTLKLCTDCVKQFVRNAQNGGKPIMDFAPTHTSMLVREYLAKKKTVIMPQPPVLASADFFLFPKAENTDERKAFCYD